jgi:transmembrane sensor
MDGEGAAVMSATQTFAKKSLPEIHAEAAAWMSRLHGPERSAALEAGFKRWLESDPYHAKVFEGMTEIWDTVGAAPIGRFPRVALGSRQRARRAMRRPLVWATAALVAGVVGLWSYQTLRHPTYATDIGERRMVELTDGSQVTLNSNTRLVVEYRTNRRHLRLERGEAYFDVATDVQRPFVVQAGDHEVTALGTVFIVRHEADRTAVTLLTGKVAVAPLTAGTQAPVVLNSGERFTISAKRVEQLDKPPLEAAAAWRRGEVVLDHTPLSAAVAEINRYDETTIVISDAATAALRVSGNYKTGDAHGFAHAIADMYGLEVMERSGELHLRPARR